MKYLGLTPSEKYKSQATKKEESKDKTSQKDKHKEGGEKHPIDNERNIFFGSNVDLVKKIGIKIVLISKKKYHGTNLRKKKI